MNRLRVERLRAAREAKGWTWTDLARRLQVEVSTPPRWERGQIQPRAKMMHRLAEVLDVPLDDLIEADGDRSAVPLPAARTAEMHGGLGE